MKTYPIYRSSCPEVFCKKEPPRNFAKFTGKHLCQSLLFNKLLINLQAFGNNNNNNNNNNNKKKLRRLPHARN